jgi:hypothetical protein
MMNFVTKMEKLERNVMMEKEENHDDNHHRDSQRVNSFDSGSSRVIKISEFSCDTRSGSTSFNACVILTHMIIITTRFSSEVTTNSLF